MPRSVFTDAYASFLKVLIETRKATGVSQTELARRVGREQPFISLIERGVRRVDVIEFCVLVRALGEEPSDVLGRVTRHLPLDLKL